MVQDAPQLTGGCQCGAIRYRFAHTSPEDVHYCHCRMCQKAAGNVVVTHVSLRKRDIVWERAAPTLYRSSSVAERGFCARCGTPISFAYLASEWMCVTLGSLDQPAAVTPCIHYGTESQVPWFVIDDALPRERTDAESKYLIGIVKHQHPDRAE